MPMKIFILSAGAVGVSPWTFTLVLLAGRVPRYLFLAWIGMRLGKDTIPYLRHHIWEFVAFAAVLFVVLYFAITWAHKKGILRANDQ